MERIQIGLSREEKQERIAEYISIHPEIKEVVYFTADKLEPLKIDTTLPVEYRTWSDAIMYKYFYPLLEKINHSTLLIYDEMMRVKKRNDLTYNCCHHYSNQTDHILCFNYLPFIDDKEEYMILVDYVYPGKYKLSKYADEFLELSDRKPWNRQIESMTIAVSDGQKEKYKNEVLKRFDELGMKDPDTIPRKMSLWVTDNVKFKSKELESIESAVLVRRERKGKNARKQTTYKEENTNQETYIYEFPNRQLEFNDFLLNSKTEKYIFVNTGLSVDEMYYEQYSKWFETVKAMCNKEGG